jgi:hypothetical protein
MLYVKYLVLYGTEPYPPSTAMLRKNITKNAEYMNNNNIFRYFNLLVNILSAIKKCENNKLLDILPRICIFRKNILNNAKIKKTIKASLSCLVKLVFLLKRIIIPNKTERNSTPSPPPMDTGSHQDDPR